MANYSTTANVVVTVNGKQAQNMLSNLEKDAKRLEEGIAKAAAAGDKVKMQKLQRELNSTNKLIQQVKGSTKSVDDTLRQLDKATPKELRKALRDLERQLNGIERGTAAWDAHMSKIKSVRDELKKVNEEMKPDETFKEKISGWFSSWKAAAIGAAAAVTGFVAGARKAVDAYASMEQEMANVRKYTGMTEDEVAALNEEFKKMDTRTSREELNRLAQEAGRLGKSSQEDVLGFVRAADKINVALDDLGEGATLTLSKLTGIFGDEKRLGTEKALLSVGSVINELSQNCSASAPYLAEFASRMGGVGAQANMSVQQIMGFAAVLDSQGKKVEASSTALAQVIVRIYKDPAKYAKVAGLDVQRFTELVKTDMNAALIELLSTLQQAGGMDVLSPMFKDMGENGSNAISTLSTLANNIEEVKNQQLVANEAFEKATSIDDEFAVQNNTVQAGLEKAQKNIHELVVELGQQLLPVVRLAMSSATAAIKMIKSIIDFVIQNKAAVIGVTVAIASYTLAVKAATIASTAELAISKAKLVIIKSLQPVITALKVGYYTLTGQLVKAAAAKKAFNLACSATPWTAIITAVGAAVAVFASFGKKVEETIDVTSRLNDVKAEAARAVADERLQINESIKAIESFNGTKSEEQQMIDALNQKYGDFFGKCKTLKEWYDTLTESGDAYCNSIYQQVLLEGKRQAALDMVAEANKKRSENAEPVNMDYLNTFRELMSSEGDIDGSVRLTMVKNARAKAQERNNKIADEIEAEAKKLLNEYEEDIANAPSKFKTSLPNSPTDSSTGYVSATMTEKERKKKEAEERRAAIKAKKEFQKELNDAKGEWEKEDALNIASRTSGMKSWRQYLLDKRAAEVKYFEEREKIYKKWNLTEDEDYAELLKKKAEATDKWNEKYSRLSVGEIDDRLKKDEMQAQLDYITVGNGIYQNEEALQIRLHSLRVKALEDKRDLYNKESEEYENYTRQIEQAEAKEQLRIQQNLVNNLEKYKSKYAKLGAEQRKKIELDILQQLYDKKMITEKQYQEWKSNIAKEYAKQESNQNQISITRPDGSNDVFDTRGSIAQGRAEAERLRADRELRLAEAKRLYDEGVTNEEQYQKQCAEIRKKYNNDFSDHLAKNVDAQTAAIIKMSNAWVNLFTDLAESGELSFDNIEDIAKTSCAVLCAQLETVSQFMSAQQSIDIANIEKRYEKEIKLAEGNSYKERKLEKQKEKELAKAKADYAKKEFVIKVAMAIGQVAQNTIMGWAAGLKAPYPMNIWMPGVLAGLAAAQGAVQIALLKKQQQAAESQGYAEGGFTRPGGKYEEAGIVHAGEWVASQKLVNNPATRPLLEALDYAQRTNTIGSITNADVSRSITAPMVIASLPTSIPTVVNNTTVAPENGKVTDALSALGLTLSALNQRLNEPFTTINTVAGDHGIRRAQEQYDLLIRNKTPKSKK